MSKYVSYKKLEITAGGGTHTLDLSAGYGVYYIYTSGSVTLTSSWTINYSGTPQEGMEIEIRWRAEVDLNGNSFTIFGQSMDLDITDKDHNIRLYYNGSSWEVQTFLDYHEDGWIDDRLFKTGSITGASIDTSTLAGNGLTVNVDELEAQPDTTNGTSVEVDSDGISLTGDSGSPSDLTYYGVDNSSNKGFHTFEVPFSQYDSGWKQFPTFSTNSTGFVSVSNYTNPQFRVIGRTVFLRGKLLIPLDDGNGSLVSDADNYPTEQRATVHTANSGISITDENGVGVALLFPQLLDDSELFPQKETSYRRVFDGRRRIQEKGSTKVLGMIAVCTKIRFTTGGKLQLSSLSNYEIPGSEGDSSTHLKTNQLRRMGTIVNTDDFALDYTNYRTSHDGSSFQNTVEKAAEQYPFAVDHTDLNDWGGFTFDIEGLYWTIDDSTGLDTIKSKFSNYTDA